MPSWKALNFYKPPASYVVPPYSNSHSRLQSLDSQVKIFAFLSYFVNVKFPIFQFQTWTGLICLASNGFYVLEINWHRFKAVAYCICIDTSFQLLISVLGSRTFFLILEQVSFFKHIWWYLLLMLVAEAYCKISNWHPASLTDWRFNLVLILNEIVGFDCMPKYS